MKLHKFIQQLLPDHEMVIIPGFGAFIQEYQPAEISEDSDEIKPPSTRLTFNPQIRNNDGLLVGYVADNTRDSHFEALQKIEKERDNWLYKLDKGEKVNLDAIGTFFRNEKGELGFLSEDDQPLSLNSFGLETTSLEEPEIPEAEETPAEPETVEETESESEETSEVADTEILEDEPADIVETESLEEEVPEEASQVVAEEQEEVEEKEEEKIPEPAPVVTTEPKEEKKRKGGWWWLLLVLIPLIGVAVFLFMKDKQPAEPAQTTPTVETIIEEETPVLTTDSIQSDSTVSVAADSLTIQVPEPEKEKLSDSTGFFLIGGSFKAQENADTYLQQLKEQGYEPFHLGKYGNFFIVGIARYKTESEALKAKDEYSEANPGSGVWVLEK
ncbi:SPOR domain-containing protein [Maribellus sp. CM-23]|uniref:HU domain-containing protein n=1 Tax=Maribellus sp. CM-23 TaxID=2781026 RepID=UPI001F33E38C|nr:SPOR domain-containing protein [Maribellus sp. CM-23]MCE4565965.1 SPOR domain-containing protein [Maribellus sp. CM-23]